MRTHQAVVQVRTSGRSFVLLTHRVADEVIASGVVTGMAHVFVQHTSCSLLLTENADPDVRRDLETLARRWAPDGDPAYAHALEGEDDMAAHARSVLSGSSLSVPIGQGRLLLGTWQGVYLWEHREEPHHRSVVVTVQGDASGSR